MKKRWILAIAALLALQTTGWSDDHGTTQPTQARQAPPPEPEAKAEPEALSEEDALWIGYNENTADEAPEAILLETLKPLVSDAKNRLVAIDLGAGGGRDTMALLARHWKVIAIDRTKQSLETLKKRAAKFKDLLEVRHETFQTMKLAPKSADLINASYALPFMEKAELQKVWPSIADALKPGAKFTGQFFTTNHDWMGTHNGEGRNFLTKEEVVKMVRDSGLTIDKLEINGWDQGKTHWEVFEVIATRPIDKK